MVDNIGNGGGRYIKCIILYENMKWIDERCNEKLFYGGYYR
jgi:hypothetical protein